MKKERLAPSAAAILFAVVILSSHVVGQNVPPSPKTMHQTATYHLVDMGTLGGSEATLSFAARILNNRGIFGGQCDTAIADPYYPNFDPFIYPFAKTVAQHACLFRDGAMMDLGGAGNPQNSGVTAVNSLGHAVGVAENGVIDPLTGYPEVGAVMWKDGAAIPTGSLGGNETLAVAINDHDQIAGFANNAVLDPLSFFGWGTQMRAFFWENGRIQDLGTLGGPDAFAGYINKHGQVAGMSYTDFNVNPTTGIPTLEPFLWHDGKMRDLGSLGGTLNFVNGINNRGQVIGQSFLSGDVEPRPVLWSDGMVTDLGSFGGSDGSPNWINEVGEVVGSSNLPDGRHQAFLWRNGILSNLGVVPGDKCSTAWSINSKSQVVGASGLCGIAVHAFLWQDGEMIDLNQFAPPGVQLTYGVDINDRGEIVCLGRDGGHEEHDVRVFLLVPGSGAASGSLAGAKPQSGANRWARWRSAPRKSLRPELTD
jgi:probable HAF family extracellular repeat protein